MVMRKVTGSFRSRHPLYRTWYNMTYRCHNSNSDSFDRYKDKEVFEGWRYSLDDPDEIIDQKFFAYVDWIEKNLGVRPNRSYTIDRIDNDKGYFPGNLRYATKKEQVINRRINPERRLDVSLTDLIEYDHKTMTLMEFSEITGLHRDVVRYRYGHTPKAEWILSDQYERRIHLYKSHRYRVRELALVAGIPLYIIQNRLKEKWSIEDVIETPLYVVKNVNKTLSKEQLTEYDKNGFRLLNTFVNLQQISEKHSIPIKVVRCRFSRNMSYENIIDPTEDIYKQNLYLYKGNKYTDFELTLISGLKLPTLLNRILNYKWSVEHAVDTPIRIAVNGTYVRDKKEIKP